MVATLTHFLTPFCFLYCTLSPSSPFSLIYYCPLFHGVDFCSEPFDSHFLLCMFLKCFFVITRKIAANILEQSSFNCCRFNCNGTPILARARLCPPLLCCPLRIPLYASVLCLITQIYHYFFKYLFLKYRGNKKWVTNPKTSSSGFIWAHMFILTGELYLVWKLWVTLRGPFT